MQPPEVDRWFVDPGVGTGPGSEQPWAGPAGPAADAAEQLFSPDGVRWAFGAPDH